MGHPEVALSCLARPTGLIRAIHGAHPSGASLCSTSKSAFLPICRTSARSAQGAHPTEI